MRAVRWACVVAALGAAAYLLLEPSSADLAAQQYRAGLVREAGFALWDNGWFAGHHTPAYSILFPPLGALLGVRVAGALAAFAAAALFALVAQRRWGERAGSVAAAWFAAGAVATLVSGRLTFLLGVAFALAAVLALQRGRRGLSVALAVLVALASPVAALFLALATVAWALAGPDAAQRAWGAAIALAAIAPAAALAALFPEGGSEPFVASAFWPALAAIGLVLAVLPARERALRIGAVLYAMACVAAFVVATPLGGNVTRLGALLAGPIVFGALLSARGGAAAGPQAAGAAGRAASLSVDRGEAPATRGAGRGALLAGRGDASRPHPALLAVLALALAYWQLYPAIRDVVRSGGDPSTAAAYHEPLVRFLESRPDRRGFRVEIAFTENHWETAHVAPSIPLARGWERQLDRRLNALFYDGAPLTPARYRAWLDEHAVAYVALPDVALDDSSRAEQRLVERGLPYLRPVWRDAHWQVFAVRQPKPVVGGVARAIELEPDAFTITARRAGDALVRVRHTRWWKVMSGRGCVRQGPDGMTRVRVLAPGSVRVQASLTGSACGR